MIVEALFGEVCGLNGDGRNTDYLRQTLPDATFRQTRLTEEPFFASGKPDILYIGSMTEKTQRRVTEKLFPLRGRLQSLMDSGTVILATGNAGEIFATNIRYEPEDIKISGLGLLDFEVRVDLFRRYHGKVLGRFQEMEIVGFQCRFSKWYGKGNNAPFLQVERGQGDAPGCPTEGFRVNNCFCTSLLGPILPLNPLFTEYLIGLTGRRATAAYQDEAMAAYTKRLSEFQNPKVRF